MIETIKHRCSLLGRILFSLIFLVSAYWQITEFSKWAEIMELKGMPALTVLLPVGIVLGLAGGLSMLLGYKARLGALAIFLFLIPSTLAFHNFWAHTGGEREVETINFLKNLAVMGGALFVLAFGAGPLSLDSRKP